MELNAMFKSVIDQDRLPVVLCDLEHTIVYMNPAAEKNYEKYGGAAILGKSLLFCHNPNSCDMIRKVVEWFAAGEDHDLVHTGYNEKKNRDVYMVALRDENRKLIGYYEKHEMRTPDTELLVYDLSE